MDIGRGIMAVWNDLAAGHEAEFDAWYQRQHLLERLRVPGFREARRYLAANGTPRYCAFYWLDSVHTLTAPVYLERLANPTRWTRRMMPHFRAMARTPGTVTLDVGCGIGGAMAWVAGMGPQVQPAALRLALAASFGACMDDSDLVRLQLWECAAPIAGLANPEAGLRAAADRVANWIICIEAAAAPALATCRRSLIDAIRGGGTSEEIIASPDYHLTRRLLAEEAPPPCTDEAAGIT